ncbi:ABC transporter transmembrane domain-containing protein [Myxococcaceae bacterium GXIMD 01537]
MAEASMGRALRRMLELARPHAFLLLLAMLLSVAATGLGLAVPLAIRELVNSVLGRADQALLTRMTLGMAGLFVLQGLVNFAGRYLLGRTGERVVADFRKRVYAHLHTLTLRFFNSERTGNLTSRLNSDVNAVKLVATDASVELLTVCVKLVGSAVLLTLIDLWLSLLSMGAVFMVMGITRLFARVFHRIARGLQDRLADTAAIAETALSSIRVVMAFARGPYEVARYGEAVERLFAAERHRFKLMAFFSSFITLLFASAITGIFWYGGTQVIAGRLTGGDLMAALFYAYGISQSLETMAMSYAAIGKAAGASERLFELLETQPEIVDAPGAPVLPPVRGHVRFENVSFNYEPGRPVLHGIDLDIQPGETVALVGPSGAGKTTLMHLVLRFFDPDQGRVLLDGHDVRSVQLLSLREQLALVSQDVQLFPDTLRENIRYGRLDATDAEVEEAARAANAHEFITRLPQGYGTEVGERGVKLSGGERQRVAIARALLRRAPVLLLDEATSALDAENEMLVKEALERLMKSRTCIVIAHRLATVRDVDRIIVVEEGRIVEQGPHAELLALGGGYFRLASRQQLSA